jgi:hypothetical protein
MTQQRLLSPRYLLVPAAALSLLACGDTSSPDGGTTAQVSFSVSTAEAAAPRAAFASRAAFATANDGPLVQVVGNDTLRIDSVRVVLAQVTLRQQGDSTCGLTGNNDGADASCTTLSSGPFIQKLPLTSGALSLFDIPIPKGTYTSIAVRVHKPNTQETGPNVVAFLQAHPEWLNKSAMVDGTFNGVAFHWSHDPPIQLTHTFSPPLVVDGVSGSNFTLKADVASWFVSTSGVLINPGTPTTALYPQIAANVAKSFKVFEDDSKKGHDDGR